MSLVKSYSQMTEAERKELIKKAFEAKAKLQEELKETKEEMKKKEKEVEKLTKEVLKLVKLYRGLVKEDWVYGDNHEIIFLFFVKSI